MARIKNQETTNELQPKRRSVVRVSRGAKRVALSKEVLDTMKAAKEASTTAVRISKALELPVQFIEKGKLVEVNAQGKKTVIKHIEKIKSRLDLTKGTKVWLKPKG
ncbi:MAG: hypothetical protein ACRDE7_04855 [Sphingobacterium sp.]